MLEDPKTTEDDSITTVIWETRNLIQQVFEPSIFVEEVRKWTAACITHNYIKNFQGEAIHDIKAQVSNKVAVLHFDFAENWTAVLPIKQTSAVAFERLNFCSAVSEPFWQSPNCT